MAQDVIITPASGKIEFSNNAVVAATIQLDSADGNLNIPNTTDVHFQNTTGTAPFLVDSTTKVTNLNADLLDGVTASALLRSNTSDSFTSGTLTFNSGTTLTAAAGATVNFSNTTGTAPFTVASTTTVTNLSADLLDGISSASFLRSDATDTATGSVSLRAGGAHLGNHEFAASSTGTGYSTAAIELRESNYTATGAATPPILAFHWGGIVASSVSIDSGGAILIRNNPGTAYENLRAGNIYANGTSLVWNTGNDGAGSGLDADTLDGSHASAFLTGNQTITLSGDVSGSGTTAITVTVADDSHNHIISNVDGLQTALDGKLSTTGTAANSQLLDSIDSTSFVRSDQDDTITGDLHFSGGLAGYGTSRVHVLRPDGADYQTQASSVTGALQITLPVGYVSDMMLMWVDVYDYAGDTDGESFSMILGGYNYSSSSIWINCFAHVISSRSDKFYNVRFGDNGSNVIIWIGETSSTWSYPQVNVRDFYGGYSTSNTAYTDGWSISFATSFGTVTKTVTAGLHADKATYATVSAHPGGGVWYPLVAHNGDSLISDTSVDLHDSGYVRAQYFNTTHATTNRTTDTIFYSSTDAYIRRNDGAGFRTSLNVPTRTGGDASGTWGISITGNAATATSATSAGNADTVDSLHAASFLRSDANDTFTGTLTTGELQIFANHPVHTGYSGIGNTEAWTTTTGQYLIISAGTDTYVNGDSVYIRAGNNSTSNQMQITTSGTTIGGNTVWHGGNDGSGSGLDADLLDGQHGSYYAVKTYWPDSVTNIGKTAQSLVNFTSLADYEKPGGYQTMMRGTNTQATVVGTPKAANYWYFNVMAVRDTANGVAALLMNYDNGDFYWGTSADPSAGAIPWRRVWSDNDFTSTTVGQWNTAYGWGNHASAGYATASNTMTFTNKSGNISQWTNNSGYLTGNQTITLSGDATGSGTTAITVTVADDSHNHIISNVDGLQTALDNKPDHIVTLANITTRMDSGFYQDGGSVTTGEGWPVNATWYHLLATTHSNTGNYYSMQLAADYYSQNNFYFRSTSNSGTQAWSEIWTSSSDGSGSGLDADLLDGVQGANFLRSDQNDTTSGILTTQQVRWGDGSGTWSGNPRSVVLGYSGGNYGQLGYGWIPTTSSNVHTSQISDLQSRIDLYDGIIVYSSNGSVVTSGTNVTWTSILDARSGTFTYKGNTIWHAGNDGSGSSLDADLLDGLHSTRFSRYGQAYSTSTDWNTIYNTAGQNGQVWHEVYNGTTWTNGPGSGAYSYGGVFNYHGTYMNFQWYIPHTASANNGMWYRTNWNLGTWYGWARIWDSNNDGSGSGLDADLLDGLHGSSYLRRDTADTYSDIRASGSTNTGRFIGNSSWGTTHNTNDGYIQIGPANTSYAHLYTDRGNFYFNVGVLYANGSTMWHAGNDGAGSGLDADLLDGIDSGSFLRSDTNDTYTGNLYLAATASIRGTTGGAWSGNPGANGKIEYHANRWYIVADSSSNRIVQFRRDGTDVSYIDNSGNFIGSADTVDGQHALEMSWGHDFSHGTFTDFNSFLNSAYFGCHFIQATTNGPGHSGATQYYQMRLALGSNYDNYALQIAIPRNVTDAQMYYRNIENSSASSWYTLGGQALTGVVVDLLTVNQINANHIAANSITAAMIQADQIDVSELKISSTASVANSIYFDGTNKRIDIKDASNVLRVRIGQL